MTHVPDLDATRIELLRLRSDLAEQRRVAPTPGIAHALKLADTYLFMALGYTAHTDQMFPEEGSDDAAGELFPNLH